MDFENRLKGNVTETLLKAVLEDSGYRIVPFGWEEVVRELSMLNKAEYANLRLPDSLSKLPDFFVADKGLTQAWLVEVKYRKEWNNTTWTLMRAKLLRQIEHWSPLYLMVFLGTPGKTKAELATAWMGMLRLVYDNGKVSSISPKGEVHKEWSEIIWKDFFRVQDFFPALSGKNPWRRKTLTKITGVLPTLKKLDIFE